MTDIIETLGPVGFVFLLRSDMFEGLRATARAVPVVGPFYNKLFNCALCLGLWMGLVAANLQFQGLDLLHGTVMGILFFTIVATARVPKDLRSLFNTALYGAFNGTLIGALAAPFRMGDWNKIEMYFAWAFRYAAGIAFLCLVLDAAVKLLEKRARSVH